MHARRLIAAPVVALVALVLVGAVIDSGQEARLARADDGATRVLPSDPALVAESGRIRSATLAAASCSGTATCSAEARARRVRQAALGIDTWPSDRRFELVRDTLRAQLHAQSALLDVRAATEVDGHASYADRARVDALQDRLDDATLAAARAQRAAGLIDRATLDALADDLA